MSFNPFIPTRGVGIKAVVTFEELILVFQSIYTYKRRWNRGFYFWVGLIILVSIHLYLQEALELGFVLHIHRTVLSFQSIYTYKRRWNNNSFLLGAFICGCFNPFIPTRGVGIFVAIKCQFAFFLVSIHLYLQEALELTASQKAKLLAKWFQSIYTYKRRWNNIDIATIWYHLFVSIHLYLQEALEQWLIECEKVAKQCFNPFIPTRGVGI